MNGDGTALGTIALCRVCWRAIQLRRQRIRSSYGKGQPYIEVDMWEHMGPAVTGPWHDIEPAR